MLATAVAGLGLVVPVQAQLPSPTYQKKAVFVRIHWDRSFYEYWYNKGLSTSMMNSLVRKYFDDARAVYLKSAMHNIDLILLDDFTRSTGPMSSYYDSAPQVGGNTRLISTMRSRLRTGDVTKTVPSGTTHLVGRTLNLVFVHANFGGLGGEVDAIGGIGSTDANMFISTAAGDLTVGGVYYPLVEQRPAFVLELLLHEAGHLFGGQHGGRNELADCPSSGREIMCAGFTGLQHRFSATKNWPRVERYMKGTLQRCNSAFSSRASCENQVMTECARTGDYTQIAPCVTELTPVYCNDICSMPQKQARVLINSFPSVLGSGQVTAGGPAQ
jgi:hypothetical protein